MSYPHVYILTYCPRVELLHGATLVFKTLRTGFPNSPIHVADGCSIGPARLEIARAARDCGAEFLQFETRVELYDFMQRAIDLQPAGQAVFVDPDVVFWESVENWQFDKLAAGRYIPRHRCDFTASVTEPRLHTSFLWFPDVARVKAIAREARAIRRGFEPFRNVMLPLNGTWRFFDNAAGLYALSPGDMLPYSEAQLDAYDHLFSGSFSDLVLQRLGKDFVDVYRDIHNKAERDYRQIRGCWRVQERYFQARSVQ